MQATVESERERERRSACVHAIVWLARDGLWYCERCDPPAFPNEVLDQRTEEEVMTLFEPQT